MTSKTLFDLRSAVALAALAVGVTAQAAGTVTVAFKDPERYADIGPSRGEREYNLRALAEHMQRWQDRLPDGQQLDIEVLDVDLAGEVRHGWRTADVRVLTGGADWPRMDLRWQLKAGTQVLKAGTERLADMNYLASPVRLRYPEALSYDVRMLDDWLRQSVLASSGR